MAAWLIYPSIFCCTGLIPFSTPELRAELKHTFWLLTREDSASALAKKLQAHPVFRDYEVILAAGDGKLDDTDEIQKSFDRVKAASAHHEKTITLSVGQLTSGVTIPEWSAVLMRSNLKSPALYMQAAFRAQNPCLFVEGDELRRKENAYVFDFDRMKFMVDGKEIELSKTEQKLLRILVENTGMNMRRELLLDRVWSDGAEYVDENALSVSIKRLRDKLGAEHAIRTVYGIGYRWE